jgi:hypothetical protein
MVVTAADREVADLLRIEARRDGALTVLDAAPYWFHTIALHRGEGIYTPGAPHAHRYRVAGCPRTTPGLGVLDASCTDRPLELRAEKAALVGAELPLAAPNDPGLQRSSPVNRVALSGCR